MQWRRHRKVSHVIGSSNHALVLTRYQDAPPSEEDEEEGLRNGYAKEQGNEGNGFKWNGQTGYKPWRTTTGSGSSSGYGSAGTAAGRSQKDEASGPPSQPKIIFNEDEYTRITTPRQDVLFKKGYLSKKKPWTGGNASTSATPSTTESQSASHSTADGSETTEDQQLLDRDSGVGEYPPMVEPGAQLSYGTFYNQASGYYYEYPVMLVGPAAVPAAAQLGPSVLATVPCGPVPLRPIEWINPAFLPKLPRQPYCVMDYQMSHDPKGTTVMEEQEAEELLPAENSNSPCDDANGTETGRCNGSTDGEGEEGPDEKGKNSMEESSESNDRQQPEELQEGGELAVGEEEHVAEHELENGLNGGPYLEPVLVHQPVHVPHMIPAVPQPYMYPGHYMFGPPLVNVNGVTIQSGPMIRTTDVAAMAAAFAKRRKRRRRGKQRRAAVGNTEDEEEGEYSSECDNGSSSSRATWTGCSTSTTTTTTATAITTNHPLNPECQEFQLRTVVASHTAVSVVPNSETAAVPEEIAILGNRESAVMISSSPVIVTDGSNACNGLTSQDSTNSDKVIIESRLESSRSTTTLQSSDLDNAAERLSNCLEEKTDVLSTNAYATEAAGGGAPTEDEAPHGTDINGSAGVTSCVTQDRGSQSNEVKGLRECANGAIAHEMSQPDSSCEPAQVPSVPTVSSPTQTTSRSSPSSNDIVSPITNSCSKSSTPEPASTVATTENSSAQQNSKRKRAVKGSKCTKESTTGPDFSDSGVPVDRERRETVVTNVANDLRTADLSNGLREMENGTVTVENGTAIDRESDEVALKVCNNLPDKVPREETVEASNEDSGFESQTRGSDYPITKAVTQWLQRVNSPDMFILSGGSTDSETEGEDELEPAKNLQGNPMPALSANSEVDNAALSRTTSCGEFARIGNTTKVDQPECNSASGVSRRKRDVKGTKRKSGERTGGRRARNEDGTAQVETVSSSDSCSQQEESIATARRKNAVKQDVDDVCEFTEKDSVAGMRVATTSRMDLKRINVRRMKKQGKPNREPVEKIGMKTRRLEDADDENDDEGIVEDTMNVKTYEKGEILVSEDGKFLATSSILNNNNDASNLVNFSTCCKPGDIKEVRVSENDERNESYEEEGSVIVSLDSIEEPDVLECWEAETIEPVITPKKILQSRGILCEGEAAEEDGFETEPAYIEHVQKYYRFARASAASIGEDASLYKTTRTSSLSRTVPNSPDQTMIESFCSEEVPVAVAYEKNEPASENSKIPTDEAFEVYESCYTGGKTEFLAIDSKMFKSRTLFGQQEDEGPIPCRAVCCNIQ